MPRTPARRPTPPASLSLRLVIVLLALVQLIAPTWHVCSMGGHVMEMTQGKSGMAASHHGTSHHGMPPTAAENADPDGPLRPLICICSHSEESEKPDPNPNGPKLSARMSHGDHVTCLALLLQTMPGAVALAPALVPPSALMEATFQARHEASPSLAILRRFRGRAPPLTA